MTWQNPIAVIQILFKLFVFKVVISETLNTRKKKKKTGQEKFRILGELAWNDPFTNYPTLSGILLVSRE